MTIRVLMIDDDRALASMVRAYLAPVGFEVAAAATAAAGLEALEREAFDLVVLDLMLPDRDGLEVCRELRLRHDHPLLMLTARGDETDRVVGLELGADDYLPKPFNPRELLARLRALARRRSRPAGRRLRFGRLEIDREARSVRLDGEERRLTSLQHDLLWILAESAGRVVGREALLERLHHGSATVLDRTVDVHVSRIRAAIEDDPRRPRRLLTVRGAGYLLSRRDEDEADP